MDEFVFEEHDLQNPLKTLVNSENLEFNGKGKEEKVEKEEKKWKCCYHGTWSGNCRKCIIYTLIWIGKQRPELKLVKDLYKLIFKLLPRSKRIYCSRCCINSTNRICRISHTYSVGDIVPIATYLFINKEKQKPFKVYLMGQYEGEYLIEDTTKFDDVKCYFVSASAFSGTSAGKDFINSCSPKIYPEYLYLSEVKERYLPTQSMKNIVVCDECMFEMIFQGEIFPTS